VDLTFSFRSTPEILRAVDLVVALPEFKKALAVDKEKILHLPYRAKEVGRVELWSLEEAKKNPKESWPIPDHYRYIEGKYACLAQKIADKILCWIEDGRCLQNTKIKINLSHIIILVRTRKDELMRAFQESFRQRNITIFSPEKIILKEHLVAKDLLAWLAVMICPDDDLSLACLLKSPLYGVSEEKLFKLCFERGENSLWQTLQEKSANDEQWQRIFADISNWQKLVAFCSPQEALIKFIAADDKRSLWAAYYGVDAHAVLDEFQDLAAQYEKEFSATIQGFRQWIMQGKHALESSVDVRIEGAVRILTVHGAKGLEAPIVFLADMEEPKKPRQALECYGDTHALPLWGAEYDKSKYASIYKKSKELNQQREEEESLRLFYVAMTRARDELYMVGFSNPNPGSWYGLAMRALSPYLRNEGDAMVLEL
jgi:ATP-dependent helicase/nuclease subunit A